MTATFCSCGWAGDTRDDWWRHVKAIHACPPIHPGWRELNRMGGPK